MNKNLKTISFAFAMFAVVGMISSTPVAFADDDGIELEAKLVENDIEILEASFEIEDEINKLEVEVEGQSFASCDISIPGHDLGDQPVQLDGEGEIELELTTPILENEVITVNCGSELSAVFLLDVDEEEHDGIELEAKLLDNLQNEVGEASFEDEDGETELEIEIESLADQSCEVSINGAIVPNGPHLFDDEGELELEPSPITVNENDAITVVVCGNEFSGTFTPEVDDDEDHDDDEEDDDHESEISTTKKNHRHGR